MNIVALVKEEDAVDELRIISPLKAIARNVKGEDHTIVYFDRDVAIYELLSHYLFGIGENIVEKYVKNYDVLLVTRLRDKRLFDELDRLRKKFNPDLKIVIDYDDNVFKTSPLSPHYLFSGTEEVKIINNGHVLFEWKDGMKFDDGTTFDIKRNKEHMENTRYVMAHADALTTTTEILRSVLSEYNKSIYVFDNCVDLNLWRKRDYIMKSDEIRLYWAGGFSHYEDFYYLSNPVKAILNKYHNAKLVLHGLKHKDKFMFESLLKGISPLQIEVHEWSCYGAYPYVCALLRPTINLVPLRNTDFNRCKSIIKWVERSAMGVPSVCSFYEPYSLIEKTAKKNVGVFVVDNVEEAWIQGIDDLINYPDMYEAMSENSLEYVRKYHDIDVRWRDYMDILNCVSKGVAVCPRKQI